MSVSITPTEEMLENKQVDQQEIEIAWEEFVIFLKDNACRITLARRYVFDHIFSRHDHFCADQVALALAEGMNRVSRGTVYHTLTLLVKAGMVKEIRDSDTHVHYEHVYGHPHHEHMICQKCNRFIEFYEPEMLETIKKVVKRKNFECHNHRVVIFGICEKCNQQD